MLQAVIFSVRHRHQLQFGVGIDDVIRLALEEGQRGAAGEPAITLDVKNAPFLQVLDQVLDQIGLLTGVNSSESLIHLSTRIDRAI